MKRLGWVTNLFIMMIIGNLMLLAGAEANHKASHPINPSQAPGGLPQCQASLGVCSANLNTCDMALVSCTTDLGSCDTDLSKARDDLGVCSTNLSTCEGELGTCEGELGTCEGKLEICEMEAQLFPATGQTTCWDDTGAIISCEGTGHDGDIKSGASLLYWENGDGTVTDCNTRLMWELKVAGGSINVCPEPPEDLHATNARCTWKKATEAWINDVNAEGGTGFAGHNDWRLPNIKELQSIVDYEKDTPAISSVFSNTASTRAYWSSTSAARNTRQDEAWNVSFLDGVSAPGSKNSPSVHLHMRAVRGPVPLPGPCKTLLRLE